MNLAVNRKRTVHTDRVKMAVCFSISLRIIFKKMLTVVRDTSDNCILCVPRHASDGYLLSVDSF